MVMCRFVPNLNPFYISQSCYIKKETVNSKRSIISSIRFIMKIRVENFRLALKKQFQNAKNTFDYFWFFLLFQNIFR
jgi:hypothetical protein